ncbi:Ycf48-like protein [compost metagenome]
MRIFFTLVLVFFACSSLLAQNFLPQNSGVTTQLNGISFSTVSTGIVVGNSGVIRKTADSGLNWSASNSGTVVDLSDVTFVGPSSFIAVGKFGMILKTTNSGSSWSVVNSGTSHDLLGIFANGQDVYITGSNGTVLKSTNSGNSWTVISTGISLDLYKCYFVSNTVGYAVGEAGTILKSFNGGQAWNFLTSGVNNYNLTSVYFTDDMNGVVTGGISGSNESIILRTINSGATWTSNDFSGTYLNALGFYDYSVGYAVGGSVTGNASTIYKTANQGTSWTAVTTSSSRQLGVCFPSNHVGYTCGLNGTILRLANNTAGIEEANSDSDIQVSPNPGSGVFYVSSNSENPLFSIEVFSVDGERITQFANTSTIDLSQYPSGIYYAVIKSESSVVTRKLVKE